MKKTSWFCSLVEVEDTPVLSASYDDVFSIIDLVKCLGYMDLSVLFQGAHMS